MIKDLVRQKINNGAGKWLIEVGTLVHGGAKQRMDGN